MNVYLIEDDGGGVTMFDAGIAEMAKGLKRITSAMGGLNRIVLGHGHADHRGAAPAMDVPIFCHPDNVQDSEGDGGLHYMHLERLAPQARLVYPLLFRRWDGGPVKISGTLTEGEEVSGFKVFTTPGHAPGQIGLLRERDGLMLTSDLFYTVDVNTGFKVSPRLSHSAFNQDDAMARESLKKAASLDPSSAWPGHANPITEDVRATLLKVADSR